MEAPVPDPRIDRLRTAFAALHRGGTFVMPNAWDPGSARILASLGFEAIATTSSGFAATLGRMDQRVTVDEVLAHAASLVTAVDVPVSVDFEDGYADTPAGVADTVAMLAATGVAGTSIEDFRPGVGVLAVEAASERVAAAAGAAHANGVVLTARAENHLYGGGDLDDTISRLLAYRQAGADVVYAPGLNDPVAIAAVVAAVDAPVNVLLLPDGPAIPELAALGVRRVSTGGALTFAAYGALVSAARELQATGTCEFVAGALSAGDRAAAFDEQG